jgi:hypothetical protein
MVRPAPDAGTLAIRQSKSGKSRHVVLTDDGVELYTANAHNGLNQILQPLSDWETADTLSKAWARRDPKAINRVDAMLASADLTMDAVLAETLARELDKVERIDRMIMSAEARRNAVLREVDRHRASVAQALRQAVNVEDAQFEEVGAKQIADRNAA